MSAPDRSRPEVIARGPGCDEALGSLAASPGVVLAAFARSALVRAANGRLLTLQTAELPLTPFSLCIAPAPAAWPAASATARLRRDVLRVGDLRVSLPVAGGSGRRRLDGTLPTPVRRIPQPPGDGAAASPSMSGGTCDDWYPIAIRQLEPLAEGAAFGLWWQGERPGEFAGAPVLRALVEALRQHDPVRAAGAVHALCGLGPGLTPSGDDALVGCLAAWDRLPRLHRSHVPRASLLAALTALAPTRTTPLSAEFVYHLAHGRISRPLDDLLGLLPSGDARSIAVAAQRVQHWGHSSGADCVCGVLVYLYAAREPVPPWCSAGGPTELRRDGVESIALPGDHGH